MFCGVGLLFGIIWLGLDLGVDEQDGPNVLLIFTSCSEESEDIILILLGLKTYSSS